jgi:hypothetical protein
MTLASIFSVIPANLSSVEAVLFFLYLLEGSPWRGTTADLYTAVGTDQFG